MGNIIFILVGLMSGISMLAALISFPIMIFSKKNKGKWGKRCLIGLASSFVFMVIFCVGTGYNPYEDEIDTNNSTEVLENENLDDNAEKEPETIIKEDAPTWQEDFSELLVTEISAAFTEIGENPDNIESIEYKDERKTDLFVRRNYVVRFFDNRESITEAFDGDKMGWVNHPSYLITTEEWNEGEPEREQYPEEYLVTIKFWDGEDIPTNINQWMHTGGGELQEK